jgi:GNAT superfamily N-acetyltransferase
MNITRRAAAPGDEPWLRDVHHAAYRDLIVRQLGAWDQLRADRHFEETWAAGQVEVLLLDGEPCGYSVIRLNGTDIEVDELVVEPGHQGRGIGTRVLLDTMELAGSAGVGVRLRTAQLNRAAGLCRRLGFSEVGRTETHILFEWRVDAPTRVTPRARPSHEGERDLLDRPLASL